MYVSLNMTRFKKKKKKRKNMYKRERNKRSMYHAHRMKQKRILSFVSRSVRRKILWSQTEFLFLSSPLFLDFLFFLSLARSLSPLLSSSSSLYFSYLYLCSLFFCSLIRTLFFFFNNTIQTKPYIIITSNNILL